LEGATTVTAIGTGGAGLGNPESDFFIQGSNCISKAAWTNATKGFIIDGLGGNFTVPTDGAVIFYAKYDAAGSLDSKANGGFRCIIGSTDAAYYHWYIGGKTTLAFASWVSYTIDPNTATVDNTTGSPGTSERWVGILATLPTTSGPTKGNPIAMDAIRYGRCDLEYTTADCTFSGAEAWANDPTRRWGLLALSNGSYLMQGFHSFGTSGASVTFSDSNKVLFILPSGNNNLTNDSVSTAFNRIEILNASSSVTWDNISISALGTRARGVFVHTAGTLTLTNCQFTDMDTFSFLAAATVTDTTFRRCNAVTAPGTTMNGSSVLASTVAADASALVWNVATDPDGLMDNMTFSRGAAAHHAIEIGTSAPTALNFNGLVSTGFNAADEQNDSFFNILESSGAVTYTISVSGGTGNFSYKSAGAVVNVVLDPVTVKVTSKKTNGDPLGSALVHLRASNGTGPFPYQESVTSINRTGSLATVAHTGHGMASNDKVLIVGTEATEEEYLGVHTITFIDANSYSYTVSGTPTTPASGTITSTFVALDGETNATTGVLSTSRVYSSNQPVTGWARKSTSSPYYKQGILTGEVDSTAGYDVAAIMVLDE